MFDVSSDAKKLRWHRKRVEDCQRLTSEKTPDALSREDFQKEKPKKAAESPDASAVLYKNRSGCSTLAGALNHT